MKAVCPVCHFASPDNSYRAGKSAECDLCRTKFEVRPIVDLEAANRSARRREMLLTQVLPLVAAFALLGCCIAAATLANS